MINELSARVQKCVRQASTGQQDASQVVDRAFLNQKVLQLEQKWGTEIKSLKQDLHRTILAHNHNSDLMRHHRDVLDKVRRRLEAQTQPLAEQVDAQAVQIDRTLRTGVAKQRALDLLVERLDSLESQVAELLPGASMGMGPMAMMGVQGIGAAAPQQPPGAVPKRPSRKEGQQPTEAAIRAAAAEVKACAAAKTA